MRPPVVATAGSADPRSPLVVLLHGRGSHEREILTLAGHLPATFGYASVRAPIAEGGGYAWFANRGIGRPLPDSLRTGLDWFREWLDLYAAGRPVFLAGFSGGAAFAGGLLLDDPGRWAGAAILHGTLPFDAGVPTTPGHLAGVPVFVAQGDHDRVIPRELLNRTWEYATGESGATATARRDPVGHEIAPDVLTALSGWLTATAASLPAAPVGGLFVASVEASSIGSLPAPSDGSPAASLGGPLIASSDGSLASLRASSGGSSDSARGWPATSSGGSPAAPSGPLAAPSGDRRNERTTP